MTFEELKEQITSLSKEIDIDEPDLIKDISDYVQKKFDNNISANERKLVDGIKNKILKGLYKMRGHEWVSKRPAKKDYRDKFGIDELEMKFLEKAGNELDTEKLIEGGDSYTKLTDKGIFEVKKIKGEL